MAESPAHRFGQLIGNLLEELVESFLLEFANRNRLYLDYQKRLRTARKGKKVTWEDSYGNVHDLDFVLLSPNFLFSREDFLAKSFVIRMLQRGD